MEVRKESDDKKIIAALGCLFIGFLFVWNITAHIAEIYELRLDAETCDRVRKLGLAPTHECVITAPFRQAGLGTPVGFLALPDGNEMQISPVAAKQTGRSAEWTSHMKTQLVMALLFWAATLALLISVFRNSE
ncbi:MAG: hypothetical protein A3F73_14455 [Gallionellales bacterium RIFCSPLOWO2_12_FULL_59_22]|nr:MAG: hypothetical protein A3H99_06860 [Gallionellales bacterium RIFCSPLOWO2_02_FULL_59_110]OGT14753.1 MAG: hypothetical protein A3F73_14455 [Gallionellales bacterium RIFCSPLOWO2_12_FULL_59_22]